MLKNYFMLKKYILAVSLGTMSLFSAQEECVSAGDQIGDTGCVSFTYRNQTVQYATVRAADGNEWLLQNLGSSSVATSIVNEAARGDYFQWGRWDDGHQLKDSEMSSQYPEPNNPLGLGSGTSLFYIGGGSPYTGYSEWFANPEHNDTWTAKDQSEVTAHNGIDPCKAIGEGWEIPTEEIWNVVLQKENVFPKPEGATNNGITRAFESNLKIAGAGARKDESFAFPGERAYIWTKTASSNPDFYRFVYLGTYAGSTTGFGGDAKSHGYSVRCVNTSNNTLDVKNLSPQTLSIVPNPANKVFSISTLSGVRKVEIISQAGQKIKETVSSKDIDVSGLSAGLYLVKITFENGKTETRKLIKN